MISRTLILRPPLIQFSKFNNFLWICWFLGKTFLILYAPFENLYCHTVWLPEKLKTQLNPGLHTLAEAHKIPFGSGLMDCSHILEDFLCVIINEEKHLKPGDCNGVDYAEIYRYIYSLINGEGIFQNNPIWKLHFLRRTLKCATLCSLYNFFDVKFSGSIFCENNQQLSEPLAPCRGVHWTAE